MKIEINCTGSDTIQLHELTEFQGELKERSAGDVEKIIKSIKKHGFSFPFFVWKNDGKNKSTGSRNAGRRTGRRLGGYERQGRIKNEIYSKF